MRPTCFNEIKFTSMVEYAMRSTCFNESSLPWWNMQWDQIHFHGGICRPTCFNERSLPWWNMQWDQHVSLPWMEYAMRPTCFNSLPWWNMQWDQHVSMKVHFHGGICNEIKFTSMVEYAMRSTCFTFTSMVEYAVRSTCFNSLPWWNMQWDQHVSMKVHFHGGICNEINMWNMQTNMFQWTFTSMVEYAMRSTCFTSMWNMQWDQHVSIHFHGGICNEINMFQWKFTSMVEYAMRSTSMVEYQWDQHVSLPWWNMQWDHVSIHFHGGICNEINMFQWKFTSMVEYAVRSTCFNEIHFHGGICRPTCFNESFGRRRKWQLAFWWTNALMCVHNRNWSSFHKYLDCFPWPELYEQFMSVLIRCGASEIKYKFLCGAYTYSLHST